RSIHLPEATMVGYASAFALRATADEPLTHPTDVSAPTVSRKRAQQRLAALQKRIEFSVPRESSVAIRPHHLQARKRTRRFVIEPDRRSQIFIVALQWHVHEASLVANQKLVADITGAVSLAFGHAVANIIYDGSGITSVQAKDHNLGLM